jgi:hypothetical protein
MYFSQSFDTSSILRPNIFLSRNPQSRLDWMTAGLTLEQNSQTSLDGEYNYTKDKNGKLTSNRLHKI